MQNWLRDENETFNKSVNEAFEDLKCLTTIEGNCANHRLDSAHYIFAEIVEYKKRKFINLKLELYNKEGDIIGDISDVDTYGVTPESLINGIKQILWEYYGYQF
jgi:hypothetical protein